MVANPNSQQTNTSATAGNGWDTLQQMGKSETPWQETGEISPDKREHLQSQIDDLRSQMDELQQTLASLREQIARRQQQQAEKQKEEPDEDQPLRAAIIDNDEARHHLAREMGQEQLARELKETSRLNIFKRIWKGNFAKRYYEAKYEREAYEKIKDKDLDANEQGMIQRFVQASVEDAENEYLDKGEKIHDDNPELTAQVKGKIRHYVDALNSASTPDERQQIEDDFREEIKMLKAQQNDGKEVPHAMADNLVAVAQEAYTRVCHGKSIEQVLDGFQVITGEARDNIKSQAHRDAIDKIAEKVETSRFGHLVPPEVVAGAAGVAVAFARAGSTRLMKTAVPIIGGATVAGVFAAWRERNHVSSERAKISRELAQGANQGKANKYEAKLAGTMYEAQSANELKTRLQEAIDSGEPSLLQQAYLEAKVRLEYSNENNIDLITYSGKDEAGQENFALRKAMLRAKNMLPNEQKEQLGLADNEIRRQIIEKITKDVHSKDEAFKRIRRNQMLKQGAKTAAVVGVSAFAIQGIANLINGPNVAATDTVQQVAEQPSTPQIETEMRAVSGDLIDGSKHVSRIGFARGNELGIWSSPDGNGFMTHMSGNSIANGRTINFAQAVQEGRLKGFLTLNGASNPVQIEPSVGANGQLIWNNSALSQVKDAAGFHGQTFEVGYVDGINPDGTERIIPIATEVGDGTKSTILQATQVIKN